MSAFRMDSIRARLEAATPGPWLVRGGQLTSRFSVGSVDGHPVGLTYAPADADFVAHARDDIEWLLDQLEQIGASIRQVS
jgi:hypothetical protein